MARKNYRRREAKKPRSRSSFREKRSARSIAETIHTSGTGIWSRRKAAVHINKLVLVTYSEDGHEYSHGRLHAHFDNTWNVHRDGLIYTDPGFLRELRSTLESHGYQGRIDYSEQGQQGTHYVDLDVDKKFVDSWRAHAQENPFSENPSPLSWLLIAGAIGGLGYAAYYFHNVAQINAQADKLSLPHVGASAMVGTMTAKTDASGNVTFSYTDPTSNQATTVVAPIASLQLYNGQYTSNVPSVQAQMNNLPNVPTAQNNFSTGASGLPQLAAGA